MKLSEAALNCIPVFPVHGIDDSGNCTCNKPECSYPGRHPVLKGGHNDATGDQQIKIRNSYAKTRS